MKHISLVAAILATLVICGCNNKKKATTIADVIDTTEDVADTTIYGICCEESAMHTLQVITDKGDTLTYALDDTDSCTIVQGGLFAGDRLAIIGAKNIDGELVAKKVLNLTSLLGKWTSIDRTFELCEGGTIVSDVKEPRPYTDWKILNGHLVLSADTFDIYALGPDSLYLENNDGIYGYKRMSKEIVSNDKNNSQ